EGAGIDFAGRHNLLMLTNLVNCYRIPAASYEGYSVVTNCCPVVANRGIGKPFMNFALERTVDAIARELGIDRAEIRFRNFIQAERARVPTTDDSASHPYVMIAGNSSNKFHGQDTAAAIGAARKVREKLLKRAALQLEVSPDHLKLNDERIQVRGAPQKSASI